MTKPEPPQKQAFYNLLNRAVRKGEKVKSKTQGHKDIRRKMRKKLINPSWEEEMKFFFSPEPETDSLIGAAVAFSKQLSIS